MPLAMPNQIPAYTYSDQGFTLIEMAIVLMIIGLLLGGLIIPLTAQMEQKNNTEAQKALSDIKEAILGYTLANGRLPCPADPAIATGTVGAGISRATCITAANSSGVVPWATLGLSETDAWGNRYTYRVTPDFAVAIGTGGYGGCTPNPTPTMATFALCSVGNLNVWSSAAKVTTIAGTVPAVIISHGKSGAGAYTTLGTQIARGSNADELENSDGSTNTDYVTHPPTPTFDDMVAWISLDILFNRMVSADKLP